MIPNVDDVRDLLTTLPDCEDRGTETWTAVRDMCDEYNLETPNELIDAILAVSDKLSFSTDPVRTTSHLGLLYVCRASEKQLHAWANMLFALRGYQCETDILWNIVYWSNRPELFGFCLDAQSFKQLFGGLSFCVFYPFTMKSLLYVASRVGFPKRALAHYMIRSWFWSSMDFMDWRPQDRDLGPGEFNVKFSDLEFLDLDLDDHLRFLKRARGYFDFDYRVDPAGFIEMAIY